MEAGMELDSLIAEKVMGECIYEIWFRDGNTLRPEFPDGSTYSCGNRLAASAYAETLHGGVMKPNPKPYSTDISAALEVAHYTFSGFKINFGGSNYKVEGYKHFPIEGRSDFNIKDFTAWSEVSAPHAICLAVLKAVQHAEDHEKSGP